MTAIVEPTTRDNWVGKLRKFIDKKREQTKAGPVIPVTRMPGEIGQLAQRENRDARRK